METFTPIWSISRPKTTKFNTHHTAHPFGFVPPSRLLLGAQWERSLLPLCLLDFATCESLVVSRIFVAGRHWLTTMQS